MLFVAVTCTSLTNATDLWRQIVVTLTVAVLFLASFLAWCSSGTTRAFSIGFAFVGWVYLVLTCADAHGLRDSLPTHSANKRLYAAIHDKNEVQVDIVFSDGSRETLSAIEQATINDYLAASSSAVRQVRVTPSTARQADEDGFF